MKMATWYMRRSLRRLMICVPGSALAVGTTLLVVAPGSDSLADKVTYGILAVPSVVFGMGALLSVMDFLAVLFGDVPIMSGYIELRCARCKRKLNLWRLEIDRPSECPKCGGVVCVKKEELPGWW